MECVVEEKVSIQLNVSLNEDGDSSDGEELFIKRNTVKTRLFDSDEENLTISNGINQTSNQASDAESDVDINQVKGKTRKVVRRYDSDSEDDVTDQRRDVDVNESLKAPFQREENHSVADVKDNVDRSSEKPQNEERSQGDESQDRIVNRQSDDESELSLSSTSSKSAIKSSISSIPKFNRFSQSDLYDAEGSSDEELVSSTKYEEISETQTENVEDIKKSKSSKEKSKKPKLKSSKNDLQDIHSESQRMVRESRVSLPYHRPRQRTLAEFLQRRKNTVLPVKSLKTSPAKLGAVWKTLEEKAKEAEEFYKSESDSEPEIKEDDKKTEETKDETSAATVDSVEVINLNQNIPSDDLVKECESSTILPLATEKVSSCTDIEPKSSSALSQGMDGHTESIIANSENTGTVEELPNEISTTRNCDVTMEDVIPKTTANENDIEMNHIPNELHIHMPLSSEDREGLKSTNMDCDNEVNDGTVSKGGDDAAKNLSEEVTEMEVDVSDRNIQESNESSTVNVLESTLESRKGNVSAPLDAEDESMSLKLDEDDDVVKTNTKLIYDENAILSDLSKTKQIDSQNNDGNLTSGDDGKSGSSENNGETVENEDISSSKEQNVTSEASEPLIGRKEQLLKAAGIFLSPQVLPSLKAESDVIDLDEDVKANPKKEVGVRDLMQRFIKYHIPKKPVVEEKNVDVGVVLVEGGGDQGPEQVKREVMSVTIGGGDPAKYTPPGAERPGARLRSLKEELQREIARKRDEEWAKREQENVVEEEDDEGEEGKEKKCNLDDEEEEELTESSSGEEEEEDEIEDDVDMSTKSRPKSDFVDDEAEESEDEGEADDEDEENDDDDEDILTEKEKAAMKSKQEKEAEKTKNLPQNEDSSKDAGEIEKEDTPAKKKGLQRVKTLDLFSSESENEDAYESLKSPPHTPFSTRSSSGHFHLPSPALPLTALQGSNGFQNSPLSGSSSSWGLTQKILFNDEESPKCVREGKDSEGEKSALRRLVGPSQDSHVSEDELLNLMSGNFVSHVQKDKEKESQEDFCLALEDTQDLFDKPKTSQTEDSFLDSCPKIKEEKELDGELQKSEDIKNNDEDAWPSDSFPVNSLNDDSDEDEILKKSNSEATKRKKMKKLAISDDEDEADTKMEDEESLKGEESAKEEELEESSPEMEEEQEEEVESELDEDDGEERVVEYDSEENAIVVEKEKKKSKARRGLEFLENEAELSEGEEEYFGSGDEDERGLDRMEREEGDADKLDSEIVRRELERIHMRQVLDEDKREVRLLQEMFFEDGELHSEGMGRERKFRWRNIDGMDDTIYRANDSGDEGKGEEEDETEEEWRRIRHERETWLREHKKDEDEDSNSILKELGEDSVLVKLGQAALMRAQKNMNNTLRRWLQTATPKVAEEKKSPKEPVQEEPESPSIKKQCKLVKRGSFLSRKDGTLEKLAEIAIKSAGGVDSSSLTSSSPVVNKAKNSRNFIFTVLSPEKKQPAAVVKKAEETNATKKTTKRKRAEASNNLKASKKTKPAAVNSIFQFL